MSADQTEPSVACVTSNHALQELTTTSSSSYPRLMFIFMLLIQNKDFEDTVVTI